MNLSGRLPGCEPGAAQKHPAAAAAVGRTPSAASSAAAHHGTTLPGCASRTDDRGGVELFCGSGVTSAAPLNKKSRRGALLSTSSTSPGLSWSSPQSTHSLCTTFHRLPTARERVGHKKHTDSPTTRSVEMENGPPFRKGWVQLRGQLWMAVWTTSGCCGQPPGEPKLSTTRSAHPPITPRAPPQLRRHSDQPGRRLSPQPTTLTTTAVFFFLLK